MSTLDHLSPKTCPQSVPTLPNRSLGAANDNPAPKPDATKDRERTVLRLALLLALTLVIVSLVILASCLPAQAAGSGMPWEAPLQKILESIEGPVAKVVAVIIIIVTGLSLAFGDMGGGFRRLIQIVFGLSIAFAASSFFLTFFSFSGGAVLA